MSDHDYGIIMSLHEEKWNVIYVVQGSTSSRGQHKRYCTSAHVITEFGTTMMEHIVEYLKGDLNLEQNWTVGGANEETQKL